MAAVGSQPDFVIEIHDHTKAKRQVLLSEAISRGQSHQIEFLVGLRSRKEYIEELALREVGFTSKLPLTASPEEKEEERVKVLNDKKTRWRFIFNNWPRDPHGIALTDQNSILGKMAGGGRGLIWGATLADIYFTHRRPDTPFVKKTIDGMEYRIELKTVISGSKMYNWCKAHEEDYGPARPLMGLTEDEEDPHVVPAYSLQQLIQRHEASVTMQAASWVVDDDKRGPGKNKEREAWELPEPWPPKSPFHAYPKPWPFQPFTRGFLASTALGPKTWINNPLLAIQEYIPQHLLPEKLVVHDPWKLLYAVASNKDENTPWTEKQDIIHFYKLKPSAKNSARRFRDQKEWEEKESKRKAIRDAFLANPHSSEKLPGGMLYDPRISDSDPELEKSVGPAKPPVYIVFPLKPARAPAKKAHLFLSPAETIGEGHHSFVYRAEFEIPRSLVVEEEICAICVHEDVERILLDEDGSDGSRRDPQWDELSGEYSSKLKGKPPVVAPIGDQMYHWREDTLHYETVYDGPYRAIQTTVGYQNIERAPYCEHRRKWIIHPLTAKTLVAAKLSIQHDRHLEREAENYQRFPRDFFEHYNGFNIVKPIQYPVPVGALVPQFYGYYVLDEKDGRNQKGKSRYLSPILLIEECGKPIVPEELTLDDRDECASLVYRFHFEGWAHNSLYRRNIVRQPGPVNQDPNLRIYNAWNGRGGLGKDWSFRMIDFGRSVHESEARKEDFEKDIADEETTVQDWICGIKVPI